jgi:N-methylhydantoinase A/oxoprolinase/acetone carboxylase beta subunit
MNHRLGIDVGGTNTDAVILDTHDAVVAKSKRPTTEDVSAGLKAAVDAVLSESGIDPAAIIHAMLGTTHSTNAIVERRGLSKIGTIRLGAPSGLAIPPLLDWPTDILSYIGNYFSIVGGGYEYNGLPISAFDKEEIKGALLSLEKKGIEALAVSCVFSPVNSEQEL